MRRRLLGLLLLSITAVPAARAQQARGCVGPNGVSSDSLYATARRLHPDVTKPENQSNLVIVALVFDNHCSLVRHAMKRIPAEGGIEMVLAALFPDSTRVTQASFEVSGFAALRDSSTTDFTQVPVVAWGILTPRGIPRVH